MSARMEDDIDDLLQELDDDRPTTGKSRKAPRMVPQKSASLPVSSSTASDLDSGYQNGSKPSNGPAKAVEVTRSVDELIAELNILVEDGSDGKGGKPKSNASFDKRPAVRAGAGMAGMVPDVLKAEGNSPILASSPTKRK
ncbi:hypothetical protein HDU96_002297 [Phlyctochytrium bullatum]|nr:hypothetical protein HDU96_002297 [Phlyctochytrium bullatum]